MDPVEGVAAPLSAVQANPLLSRGAGHAFLANGEEDPAAAPSLTAVAVADGANKRRRDSRQREWGGETGR